MQPAGKVSNLSVLQGPFPVSHGPSIPGLFTLCFASELLSSYSPEGAAGSWRLTQNKDPTFAASLFFSWQGLV